jgi:hypothetical protein
MSGATIFSDTAWFHLTGYVNCHNTRIWSTENPRAAHEFPPTPSKLEYGVKRLALGLLRSFSLRMSLPHSATLTWYISSSDTLLKSLLLKSLLLKTGSKQRNTSQHGQQWASCPLVGRWNYSKGLWPPRSPDFTTIFVSTGLHYNQCLGQQPGWTENRRI